MIYNSILKCINIVPVRTRNISTAVVLQAARKGTRMKREAKKKASKKEVVKKVFVPYQKQLELQKVGKLTPRHDDSSRDYPVDNVFFQGMYRWIIYTVEEAMALHKETQHPTQFNMPNADVVAHIELSMSANKKNQYIDEFSNILLLPNIFEAAYDRTILAICKDEESIEKMKQMGVTFAIGPEAIKMIEKGNLDLKMYEHIICYSSLLPDLISIRNILRKKFPSPRNGTAGTDLVPIVTRLLKGIYYKVEKDKYDHDFGKILAKIGTLQMDPKEVEENLKVLINDVENSRPKTRSDKLITLVNLRCANSREVFKIDHKQYLPPEEVDEDEEEEASAKA